MIMRAVGLFLRARAVVTFFLRAASSKEKYLWSRCGLVDGEETSKQMKNHIYEKACGDEI